jgi:hypothetical protein
VDFEEIKSAVKKVRVDALRADDRAYFEAVLFNGDIPKLAVILEQFFGKPVFPAKNSLPFAVSKHIDESGGIMPGQTLYYWSNGKEVIFVMLWPWKDDRHLTLKLKKQ